MSVFRLNDAQVTQMFREYVEKHYKEITEGRFCYFCRTSPSADIFEVSIADTKEEAYAAILAASLKPVAPPKSRFQRVLEALFGPDKGCQK